MHKNKLLKILIVRVMRGNYLLLINGIMSIKIKLIGLTIKEQSITPAQSLNNTLRSTQKLTLLCKVGRHLLITKVIM